MIQIHSIKSHKRECIFPCAAESNPNLTTFLRDLLLWMSLFPPPSPPRRTRQNPLENCMQMRMWHTNPPNMHTHTHTYRCNNEVVGVKRKTQQRELQTFACSLALPLSLPRDYVCLPFLRSLATFFATPAAAAATSCRRFSRSVGVSESSERAPFSPAIWLFCTCASVCFSRGACVRVSVCAWAVELVHWYWGIGEWGARALLQPQHRSRRLCWRWRRSRRLLFGVCA